VRWAKLWPVDATQAFNPQNFPGPQQPGPQRPPECPPMWVWYGRDASVPNRATVTNLVGVPLGNAPRDWRSTTGVFNGPGFIENAHVDTATAAYRDRGVYDWLLTPPPAR
jgi:hypothetical protein